VPGLHRLLLRQLRRLGLDAATLPSADAWSALLERVSRAYNEGEQDRYLMERSQELASQEMNGLSEALRRERDGLEARVLERTEALRLSEARLASLVSLSADWIWEQDAEMRMTYITDGVRSATGLEPADLLGRRRQDFSAFDAEPQVLAEYEARLAARQPFRDFVYATQRQDGSTRHLRISGEPMFDAEGRFLGYRGVGSDITAATMAARQVEQLARFDGLTGLPNRTMFIDELDRAIARARRTDGVFALCFIDLDRFKNINDSLGHAAGDELLKLMARRLRGLLRETDLVARLGGDEFVVLLEGSVEPLMLAQVGHKMLAVIAEPLMLHDRSYQVSGSIGIALFPADGGDAATLLKHADAAMYLAKQQGKNNVQFYTGELADAVARQFALESELRGAIERDELVLHYQPKTDIASGAMLGVEALVRWQHPVRGLVPPGDFIPLAEERGLIVPIGRWVIDAACRQLREWLDAGLNAPRCAVNLSAHQLASLALIDDIRSALARHRLPPDALEVELTESVLMADPERANGMLQQLHAMGVRISIDDFGTGYSSLSYLKRFPAQALKIDRSFIRGLPADVDDVAITQAVIAMAHSLGLQVVAEGVETAEQLAMLRGLGCDEAQGFHLHRPLPAEKLSALLQQVPLLLTQAARARSQSPSTAAIATAVRSTLPVLRPATQMRPERTR